MTDDESFNLLLPFDTGEPEFTRGVEVGRLWELLKTGEPVEEQVHASNAEMCIRMGEAVGRPATCEWINDDWMIVQYEAGSGERDT